MTQIRLPNKNTIGELQLSITKLTCDKHQIIEGTGGGGFSSKMRLFVRCPLHHSRHGMSRREQFPTCVIKLPCSTSPLKKHSNKVKRFTYYLTKTRSAKCGLKKQSLFLVTFIGSTQKHDVGNIQAFLTLKVM
jgi:hypothetical protein